jgi:hypothetical protein
LKITIKFIYSTLLTQFEQKELEKLWAYALFN